MTNEEAKAFLARLKYDMEKGFDVTMNLEHMTYDVLHVIEAMKDYRIENQSPATRRGTTGGVDNDE